MADTRVAVKWSLPDETANAAKSSGSFCLFPDAELEEVLWDAIEERNLYAALQAEFQITRPLWYGLWMDSPLSQRQSAVLYKLLRETARQSLAYRWELRSFLVSLRKASVGQGRMSVELYPPGHTDFDCTTTFAHCPRCKAEAPLPRWREYPSEQIDCPVCAFEYSPAETYSRIEDGPEVIEARGRNSREVGCVGLLLLLTGISLAGIPLYFIEAFERKRRLYRRAKRTKHPE